MKRLLIIVVALTFFLNFLVADGDELKKDGENIKDRTVNTLDLGEAGKDKLKLGISLGYPMSGITAGWQVAESLELDLLVGTFNYNSFAAGFTGMFSLVDIKIGEEIFPLTLGPVVYTGISGNSFSLSAGALLRFEYTFDFKLNFYLESGVAANITNLMSNKGDPIGFPTSLGIRYIF